MKGRGRRILAEAERLAAAGDAAGAAARLAAGLPSLSLEKDEAALHARCLKELTNAHIACDSLDELGRTLAAARTRYADALRADLEALALVEIARLETARRRERPALAAARSAVRLARATGDARLEGDARVQAGITFNTFGRLIHAERALARSCACYRRAGVAPETLARPLMLRALVRRALGDSIGARRAYLAALDCAERSRNVLDVFQTLFLLAALERHMGRARASRRYAIRAVRAARDTGNALGEARVLQLFARHAAEAGHVAWAARLAGRAAEIAGALREPHLDAYVVLMGAEILRAKGRLRESLAGIAEAAEALTRMGMAWAAQILRALGAVISFRSGDLGEARRAIEEASPELVTLAEYRNLTESALVLSEIDGWLGRPDRGRDEIARVRRILRSCRGFGYPRGLLLLAVARDLRLRGRRGRAAATLERARRLLARSARVEDRIDLGLETAAQAGPDRARAILLRLERRARAAKLPWPLVHVLLAAGRAAMGRGEAAPAGRTFKEALAIAVAHGFRLVEVEIEEALADVADVTGNTADAAGLRERAVALRRECGAALPSGGLRLTRREREVATLVCAGLLNKEIAGRLGVAEFTVKNHIRNIFARTGARNRADLVRLKLTEGSG